MENHLLTLPFRNEESDYSKDGPDLDSKPNPANTDLNLPLPSPNADPDPALTLTPGYSWTWRTRRTMSALMLPLLLSLLLTEVGLSSACSSRSTPKPRPPPPTLRPNITIQTYTCPPEYDAHYCLNGATCFTVKIGDSILYNCECAEGYMGQRCEFKDLDGSYLPSKQRAMLEQASVSGAVAVIVLFVVLVCGYAYVRRTREKMRRQADQDMVDAMPPRTPFSPYYYNIHNPSSLSISQTVERYPMHVFTPAQASTSFSSHPSTSSHPHSHSQPKKPEPPDPR